MQKLYINAIVQLITDKYGINEYNPYYTSKFSCLGVVSSIYSYAPLRVRVKWDNNTENDYSPGDLQIINTSRCKSIW